MSDTLIDAANAISGSSPRIKAFAQLAANRIIELEQDVAKLQPQPPAPTWDDYAAAIVAPNFTPVRTRTATSAAQLFQYVSDRQPGDVVLTSGGFTVGGQVTVSGRISGYSLIDLSGCKVAATAAGDDGVYVTNCSGLILRNLDATAKLGGGINIHAASDVYVLDANLHDCGGTGFNLFPSTPGSDNIYVRARCTNNGTNLTLDNHQEPGTGLHAGYIGGTDFPLSQSRIALDVYRQPTGAALQAGSGTAPITDTTVYLRVDTLGLPIAGTSWQGYAQSQVAGNVLQTFGGGGFSNVVAYLWANQIQGRMVDNNGATGTSRAGILVPYARGTHTCLSPALARVEPGVSPTEPFDTRGGTVYGDVQATVGA